MLNAGDYSFWDTGRDPVTGEWLHKTLDWKTHAQQGWYFGFIKCSEGLVRDFMFPEQWASARGYAYRSAYHFFRPSVDVIAAVNKFVDFTRNDPGELPPVLDLEADDGMTGYTVAQKALLWLTEYEKRTGIEPIVYSSLYFLRLIAAQEHLGFAKYHLWLAQYYYDNMDEPARSTKIHRVVTEIDSIPFPSIPSPFKTMPFFQWTAKGSPLDVPGYYTGAGSKKSVDFNKFDGTLQDLKNMFDLADLPVQPPPPDDVIMPSNYKGITNIRGKRNGWDFSLQICDDRVTIKVYHTTFDIATSVAQKTNANIVTNGGEPLKVNGVIVGMTDFSVDNERVYQPRTSAFNPSLVFYADGRIDISNYENNKNKNVLHALSGNRLIVEMGVNVIPPDSTDDKYTEGHSRTCFGLSKTGQVMVLTSRGAYPNQGLRLYEVADILVQYGAHTAFDGGGGGDTIEVTESIITLAPENPGGSERYLLEFVLIYAEKEGDETVNSYYKYKATGNRAIRTAPGVDNPRIVSNSDHIINTFTKGGATDADRYTLKSTDKSVINSNALVGDVWVKVYDNNGKAVDGWEALTHKGEPQLIEELVPGTTPPPSGGEDFTKLAILAKQSIETTTAIHDYEGTLTYTGSKPK